MTNTGVGNIRPPVLIASVDPKLSVHVVKLEVYCSEMYRFYFFKITYYFWFSFPISKLWPGARLWAFNRSSAKLSGFNAALCLPMYHFAIQRMAVGKPQLDQAFRCNTEENLVFMLELLVVSCSRPEACVKALSGKP